MDKTAQPWFRVLPEDGILTIVLLVIMVYITISSIQSVTPPWAPGLEVLTGTTGIGLLLGYLTVQQGRLPNSLVQFVAVVLGILFAFHQTALAVVGGDHTVLWDRTVEWFHRAILLRQSSDDNAVFLLFLAVLSFLLAFISVWLVIRTRRPWLAALANGVVLLINLNWSTADKTIFFLVIYLLATLLLLVRFTLAENMRRWRARGLRFSPDLSWDFMQAGAIFAVVVLLLAYLLPSWPANAALTDWWNSPNNPWSNIQQGFESLFGGVQGNGPGVINFFGGDLQLTGTVNLPNIVILRYNAPNGVGFDPSQYLITRTLNVYNGQNAWTGSQTRIQSYGANQAQPPTTEATHLNSYKITVVAGQAGSPLFAPGDEAASFSVPSQTFQDVATGQPVAWTTTASDGPGATYQATGYVSNASIPDLRSVAYPASLSSDQRPTLYPDNILAEYLSNTPDIPQDVVDLTHQIVANAHATTMYDAAAAIESYLHDNFTYTLSIQDTPPGEDAISWFLQQKQGFCTYFATTMAIMGRVLGMPTRVALGFAAGKYDTNSNSYLVRGTEAHVWPQIYFANYGWINFEPTASFTAFSRAATSGTGGPLPTVNPGGTNSTPQTGPNGKTHIAPQDGGLPGSSGQTNPVLVDAGLSASLIIVLLLIFALLFTVWWRLIFRGLSPITAAFARITRLGTWAGAPPRRSQTPDEYAEQLAHVLPGQRPALLRLSALYARERYGGAAPEETTRESLQLYDQVRRPASLVILRRLRTTPGAFLRRGRKALRNRRHRTDD